MELAVRRITREDLAEQSIDDLLDIDGIDDDRAGKLIMAARSPLVRVIRRGLRERMHDASHGETTGRWSKRG